MGVQEILCEQQGVMRTSCTPITPLRPHALTPVGKPQPPPRASPPTPSPQGSYRSLTRPSARTSQEDLLSRPPAAFRASPSLDSPGLVQQLVSSAEEQGRSGPHPSAPLPPPRWARPPSAASPLNSTLNSNGTLSSNNSSITVTTTLTLNVNQVREQIMLKPFIAVFSMVKRRR